MLDWLWIDVAIKQDMESGYEQILSCWYYQHLCDEPINNKHNWNNVVQFILCAAVHDLYDAFFYPIFKIFILHATYDDVFVDPTAFMWRVI